MNADALATDTIKELRKKKLSAGIPFMINSDILETSQCFLEYPNGLIKIVEADSKGCDFIILVEYNLKDSNRWRKKLKLI